MQVDYQTYEFMRRRAAFPILQRFGVNRYELWLLVQLCGCLRSEGAGRNVISRVDFFKMVTRNGREWRKMQGYCTGLLRNKLIGSFEYVSRPGSQCIGPSALGLSVVAAYERELSLLLDKFKAQDSVLRHTEEHLAAHYKITIAA